MLPASVLLSRVGDCLSTRQAGQETLPCQEQELGETEEAGGMSANPSAVGQERSELPAPALGVVGDERAPGGCGRLVSAPTRNSAQKVVEGPSLQAWPWAFLEKSVSDPEQFGPFYLHNQSAGRE